VADPTVGSLAPVSFVPPPYQPGGPGTPVVFPFETVNNFLNEKTGMFYPGCGHSIMHWEIAWCSVGGVPSAIVKCPLCGYINSIWTPASLIEDVIQYPFIFG
jgi:hypothetical protein